MTKRPVRPELPITPDQRTMVDGASPQVRRTLLYVAERQIARRHASPRRVWAMYHLGDPRRERLALGDRDPRDTLTLLRPYGVRWAEPLGTPPGVELTRPVYRLLRPDALAAMTELGLYPPRDEGGKIVHWRGGRRKER
jgi:isocitrate dehydrogenase